MVQFVMNRNWHRTDERVSDFVSVAVLPVISGETDMLMVSIDLMFTLAHLDHLLSI